MLSELERTKRIDSEFYRNENLQIITFIKSKKFQRLTDMVDISDGNHMSISDNFVNKGIPYYRGQDIHSFFIENTYPICITEDIYNSPILQRSHLKKNDILLSIVGTIGKIALVSTNNKATCSCKLAILRPKSNISSELLAMFLSSRYGQNQIRKLTRGAVQMGLILEDMDQLFVPVFSESFDSQIYKKILLSKELTKQSQSLYSQAEEVLLKTIGLKNFKLNKKNTNIKNFKESFSATGRLDAEYYQPKYDDYIQLIEYYSGGFKLLEKSCDLKDNNFIPKEAERYQYIELSNIGNSGNITGCTLADGKELPLRARRKVNANDVIISSIEGSLGSCAMITDDYDNALCSTGFYVINSHVINSETLLVLFKSEVMQNILKQSCSGTILTAINKYEFMNIPIPIINNDIQQQIAKLIKRSFSLRLESEKLLEEAKEMVEKEIEGK